MGNALPARDSGIPASKDLPEPAEFAAELLDVLAVQVDCFLVGLQALLHPRVVALVARAYAFLLGELLLRVGQQLLLVLELGFEDLATVLVAVHSARGAARRRRRCGSLRGNHLHFLADQRAVLAHGVALDVRIGWPAARIRDR